jgi:ABC-type transport system involved in multi-copper enzyme maturation permease subunit
MLILKDPAMALRMGLISAKAQILAGSADWYTNLNILAQATGIGGLILFALIASWVFGREYADHTVRNILALPTSRSAIVLAKLVIIMIWSFALIIWITAVGLIMGFVVGLPPTTSAVIWDGMVRLAVTGCLTIALVTPVALVASAGHGYLPPMAFAILTLMLAQVLAAAGWGEFFPWAIPALYAGMAGPEMTPLGATSFAIICITSLAGLAGLFFWWNHADQTA